MASPAPVVYSPEYFCDIGPHVFPVVKFRLLRDRLVEEGDVGAAELLEPRPAPRVDLLLVHTPEYLEDLEQLRLTPRTLFSELPLDASIVRAYVLAAGGTTLAAREALVRGAGINLGGGFHHAGSDRGRQTFDAIDVAARLPEDAPGARAGRRCHTRPARPV